MTEADVRRIVREELISALRELGGYQVADADATSLLSDFVREVTVNAMRQVGLEKLLPLLRPDANGPKH